MPVVSATCYELLGVPVEVPTDALESAWKLRRLEAQQRLGALAAEEVEALCARVDEAFRILADPIRSQRYRRYRAHLDGAKRAALGEADPTELPEWGHDPDGVLTDPGLRAWPHELAPVTDEVATSPAIEDLDLLADVVRAASLSQPLPDARDLPPWRTPDAPVLRSGSSSAGSLGELAPASFGPDEVRTPVARAPWTTD